jgi:hypothetical protein
MKLSHAWHVHVYPRDGATHSPNRQWLMHHLANTVMVQLKMFFNEKCTKTENLANDLARLAKC